VDLKRIDGWTFALFAAICAAPFFAPLARLDFSQAQIDRRMLLVLTSIVFVLARFAASIAQRRLRSSAAWIWIAGICCVPLFSSLGIATALYDQYESQRLFDESMGFVEPSLPLYAADVVSGLMGLLLIWVSVTFAIAPICLAGTAIFVGLHWIARATAASIMDR
jgi:lysylphosphatidylglycerol synthetase-like protein (DUF2156 family)